MRWAQQQQGANDDALLLYYLFVVADGPDVGVEGAEQPPQGEVPDSVPDTGAAGGQETQQFDSTGGASGDTSGNSYSGGDSGSSTSGGATDSGGSSGGSDSGGGGGGE